MHIVKLYIFIYICMGLKQSNSVKTQRYTLSLYAFKSPSTHLYIDWCLCGGSSCLPVRKIRWQPRPWYGCGGHTQKRPRWGRLVPRHRDSVNKISADENTGFWNESFTDLVWWYVNLWLRLKQTVGSNYLYNPFNIRLVCVPLITVFSPRYVFRCCSTP